MTTFQRLVAVAIAAPWIAWAVVRGLSLDASEEVVLGVTFTPFAALTSPLPVIIAAVMKRWIIAGVALLAAGVLIAAVLSRAVADGAAGDGRPFTIMSLNLDDGHADPEAIMRLARTYRVDLLCL